MAEYFPGYTPEASSDDDDDSEEKKEKKSSKKAERKSSKERQADDKAEKRELEEEAAVEKLSSDEMLAIAVELARLRAEAAKQELIEAANGSVEQTEVIPVVEFDESLQRNLQDGQSFEEAIDNAEAAATELLGDDVPELTDAELADDGEAIEPPENTDEDDPNNNPPQSQAATSGSGGSGHGGSGGRAAGGAHGGGAGTVPPVGAGGAGHGGGATPPPAGGGTPPPAGGHGAGAGGPAGPGGPMGPAGPGGPMGPGGGAPNVLMAPAVANVAPTQAPERESAAPYLLAGGLVGYLIGRRRGRIKTERRLNPIQKKLEKQVVDLENQIALREEKIRKLTRKQAETQENLQADMAERKLAKQAEKAKRAEAQTKTNRATEKLGKLAAKPEYTTTRNKERSLKPVESMKVTELLAVAERVKFENGNLKRLFEANRIDEKGLRRVLKAYLSGQAFERVLREELHNKQVEGIEQDSHYTTKQGSATLSTGQSPVGAATPPSAPLHTQTFKHTANVDGTYSNNNQPGTNDVMQQSAAQYAARQAKRKKQTTTAIVIGIGILLVLLLLTVF